MFIIINIFRFKDVTLLFFVKTQKVMGSERFICVIRGTVRFSDDD